MSRNQKVPYKVQAAMGFVDQMKLRKGSGNPYMGIPQQPPFDGDMTKPEESAYNSALAHIAEYFNGDEEYEEDPPPPKKEDGVPPRLVAMGMPPGTLSSLVNPNEPEETDEPCQCPACRFDRGEISFVEFEEMIEPGESNEDCDGEDGLDGDDTEEHY